MSLGPVLQVKLGLTQNSESCHSFFRRCIDFGEIIAALSTASIAYPYPTFSRLTASRDLQERIMTLTTEAVDLSAENDGRSPGLSPMSPPSDTLY